MNLIEIIADALTAPKGARNRLVSMGVAPEIIEAVMFLNAEITDDFPACRHGGRTITFKLENE